VHSGTELVLGGPGLGGVGEPSVTTDGWWSCRVFSTTEDTEGHGETQGDGGRVF